jgi:tRNA threonylcarbamoyladenosine biosynthesis protein TsaB
MTVPCLLAFDTSTEQTALALCSPAGRWTDRAPGGAQASASLLPRAQGLLHRAGMAWRDLDAVAFGRGPGAFTGLRTSCAVAQGLAFGLSCPVLPVDSLLLVADDARAQTLADGSANEADAFDVVVAMDARMDEAYAARYRHPGLAGAGWATLQAPALYALPALAALWAGPAPGWLAGSAWSAFEERLSPPATARRRPVEADRAAALGRLAEAAWAAGQAVDAAQALPLYLRDKVAWTTAEREARRAAAAA